MSLWVLDKKNTEFEKTNPLRAFSCFLSDGLWD